MAADLGELLVPYMPTIRVPRTDDRVYKSECAFSYDSPESEGGLYVCMNTFLGFGREHVERHYRKTGQCVYLHLKRHVREKATGAAGGTFPRRRNGKIFLDLESNTDPNGDDYEYEDEAKLVIFPDHFEIALPNIEELPALVTIACDAVLHAKSPYQKQDPESWEELHVSKYANSLVQMDNGVKIPPSGWKCAKCDLRDNLWLNLTDGSVLCGRWFFDGRGGNGHALDHYKEMGYPLAVKLGTITPDGADVYSFEEEEAVIDPHVAKHLAHFGIDMLQMHTPQLPGISSRMLKALISKGHLEFSSSRLQDAQELFLHLINLVERNGIGSENPSDVFRFLVEERVQCCQSRKVRYTERVDYLMQLPVAMEAATNRDELIAYELKKKEAEMLKRPPPELVRARVPFSACLQAFTEPENVNDFWSSALQAKSAGIKTSRFASFPEYLVVQIKKFTFGLHWVPKKFDVSVDMPDLLDINHLRAVGLQPGEEELPDIAPPIIIPEDPKGRWMNHFMDSPEVDESSVMQLAEMGFPLEACRKAVYYTGNMGAEVAFNWIIAHMEEPDFAEPLTIPGMGSVASASPAAVGLRAMESPPPEEIVAIITSMGFQRNQAIQALKATKNNLERALEWIFSHPESEEESASASDAVKAGNSANGNIAAAAQPEGPRVKDGSGRYKLFGFISHMGPSTMCGHYVCHIKKEGRWVIYNDHKVCASERLPKDLGYIYFYHRISC
uniref:Ubiquitin carboxyl-terminal hydrolase 13 n=1 Tax=Geotrypetes seraphini TaxID=260995 RepID=A0A6P8SAP7_GEOSA|nr:ubiquitin carboxyl-terminal hydrolase 13 isoform X4 [Geotrypetes seraphini]